LVEGRQKVFEELREENIQRLDVSNTTCTQADVDEIADSHILGLSSGVVEER